VLADDLQEIVVDLREPTLQDGVFQTQEGGVISAEGIRIQACRITFTRKDDVSYVIAEGDLMLEYGDYTFVGRRLEYDFITGEGVVYDGRSALGPWYAGGETIHLCPDQSYRLENAFVTTCENVDCDWQLRAREVRLRPGGWLMADYVNVLFLRMPIFYIPNFRTNFRYLLDAPIRYRAQVAGVQGSRVGMRYRFLDIGDLRAFLRAEYILGRGPAAGIDTEYCPDDGPSFFTQSYAAHDRSINDPNERWRYRLGGTYDDCLWDGHLSINGSYDFLSDREMAQDFRPMDFRLHTARLSHLTLRHESDWTITNLRARGRLRTFQEASQELPCLKLFVRPFCLGPTGIVSSNRLEAAYLEQVFARSPTPTRGFHSARLATHNELYRPVNLGPLTFLPEASYTGIFYSDTRKTPEPDPSRLLSTGHLGIEAKLLFTRCTDCLRHRVEPYARYDYFTTPSVEIPGHFIFSIDDGYVRLTRSRFGIRSQLYQKGIPCLPEQLISFDLYTYAFLNPANKIESTFPRIYLDGTFKALSWLNFGLRSAWNQAHNRIDHFNPWMTGTLSEDLAFRIEYRARGRYAWRKANYDNFVLDTFTAEPTLLATPLSDKRQTLLSHLFLRLTPTLGTEWEGRIGWGRSTQPAYFEGRVTIHATLLGRWHLSTYYDWSEADKSNWGLTLRLGSAKRPYGRKQPSAW
jgi:hypothetical protein